MDKKHIEPTSLHCNISEYGKIVRQYSDTNYERFNNSISTMITEHLKHIRQNNKDEVKNITIEIYTY